MEKCVVWCGSRPGRTFSVGEIAVGLTSAARCFRYAGSVRRAPGPWRSPGREVVGAVGEHAFLDLRQQVDVARGVQLDALEVGGTVFLDAQQLGQGDPAGAWQRRGIERVALPVDAHRFAPPDLVVGEVLVGDQSLVLLHLCHQQVGGMAFVELVRALVGDTLQGLRQVRLEERLAGLHVAEVVAEVGLAVEQGDGVLAVLELLVGDLEALLRVADGRGQQLAPGQLAEPLVGFPEAHHGARHAGGLGADQAEVLDHLALVVQVHGLARGLRRHLAVVEEVRLAVHVQGHEAAAADVAGLG